LFAYPRNYEHSFHALTYWNDNVSRNQPETRVPRPLRAVAASNLAVTFVALCEAQDAATMRILAIAKLARHALDSEMDDAMDTVGHALDSIMALAGEANAAIDEAQAEVEHARNHVNREGADGSPLPSAGAGLRCAIEQ